MSASGSWVVALDNLSGITLWLQDALCRAATGAGNVRRQLYSDSELAVLNFRRVIITTGIDLGAIRGDLADRSIIIKPERIPPTARRLEADLGDAFAKAWPTITAGLYDLAAQVLEVLPSIRVANPPRMADFASVLAAVDQVTGSNGLDRYTEHGEQLAEDVLDGDEVAVAVVAFMAKKDRWNGTATELLDKVTPPQPGKHWPTTAHHFSGRLRRATPVLAIAANLTVDDDRVPTAGRSSSRVTLVTLEISSLLS